MQISLRLLQKSLALLSKDQQFNEDMGFFSPKAILRKEY